MKKVALLFVLFAMVASVVSAVPFQPTLLKMTAPTTVKYAFDGSELTIPVTVAGTPAGVYFSVFTKGMGTAIGKVRNGFLGWHYVNGIDTCLYISPLQALAIGTGSIKWNGVGEGGAKAPAGDYTYYLWGVDNVNIRIQCTKQMTFNPWGFRTYVTKDAKGVALAKPVMYRGTAKRGSITSSPPTDCDTFKHTMYKWVIGNDPEDVSLRETTATVGGTSVDGLAFLPTDNKYFFHDVLKKGGGIKSTRKYEWVPNNMAVMQQDWGNKGEFVYTGAWTATWNFGPGCVSDGKDILWVVNADISGPGKESQIIYVDIADGTEIKRVDMADWWVNVEDGKAGGQNCGGPTELSLNNGVLGLGSHSTCVNQIVNPYEDDEAKYVLWSNTNGDTVGDHNYEVDAKLKWVCNDYVVGPYKYSTAVDKTGNLIFPAYGLGAVSFGLYLPDGSSVPYFSLAGETQYQKYGVDLIDYGSAYDGLYTTSNVGITTVNATVFYLGYDTFKGTITNKVGVADAPAAFAVSQNVPNPFNPTTSINFTLAKAGKVSVDVFNVAGQKVDTIVNGSMSAGTHSVTWNASKFSNGVYFYTVKSGDFSKTLKMTLLK